MEVPEPSTSKQQYASTYVAGEDQSRLKSAAKYFGVAARAPLKSVREALPDDPNRPPQSSTHSRSILKFGSTVWSNVGLLFSDSTLEAARMHSVGVTAKEERLAGDGTLHLMSVAKRRKGTKPTYEDLTNLFHQTPLEPLEYEVRPTDEEYEEVVIDSVEGGSITAAIFGIVKGTVGPAALYLPRGFAMAGYSIAIPAMLIATSTYLYSATRLLQCWKAESDQLRISNEKLEEIRLLLEPTSEEDGIRTGYGSTKSDEHDPPPQTTKNKLLTYPELAKRAFGKWSFLVSGGIAAMQFGVCLTYLIFVPQNLVEATIALYGVVVPKQVFLAFMLALEIPLCWIRDIRKLTPINILATAMIAFGLVSVLCIAITDPISSSDYDDFGNESLSKDISELYEDITKLPRIQPTWVLFIGTSFFCFEGSISLIVPLQNAVYRREDRVRFPVVNQKITAAIVAFYICFSTICWASFGDSVQTALTASLPKGFLSTIVQFAYSIAVIFTFPLQAFPALEVVCQTTETKTGKNETSGNISILRRNVIATVSIWLLGAVAIVAIDYLGNVVSLLGSLVGIPIALVYPPLMHNKLVPKSSLTTKLMNCCLSFIGVLAAGAASYTTIASWNEGAEG